jgi:myosin-light-chain kinase
MCLFFLLSFLFSFRVSGLSPFAGETDIETMANVTIGKYDFQDDAFVPVSTDAMDFIERLLRKDPK